MCHVDISLSQHCLCDLICQRPIKHPDLTFGKRFKFQWHGLRDFIISLFKSVFLCLQWSQTNTTITSTVTNSGVCETVLISHPNDKFWFSFDFELWFQLYCGLELILEFIFRIVASFLVNWRINLHFSVSLFFCFLQQRWWQLERVLSDFQVKKTAINYIRMSDIQNILFCTNYAVAFKSVS